jgi:hypothetical protein
VSFRSRDVPGALVTGIGRFRAGAAIAAAVGIMGTVFLVAETLILVESVAGEAAAAWRADVAA